MATTAIEEENGGVLYRVAVDHECGPEEWWEQARCDAENGEAPDDVLPLLRDGGPDVVVCGPVNAEVVRYAADGHAGSQDPADPTLTDGAVLATGALAECVAAIRRRIGADHGSWAQEDGLPAYHESADEGCGGWAVRPC